MSVNWSTEKLKCKMKFKKKTEQGIFVAVAGSVGTILN